LQSHPQHFRRSSHCNMQFAALRIMPRLTVRHSAGATLGTVMRDRCRRFSCAVVSSAGPSRPPWTDLALHASEAVPASGSSSAGKVKALAKGDVLAARLEPEDADARLAALSDITQVEEWDATVVPVVAACASDHSHDVRRLACGVLAEEALRGAGDAARAVVMMSRDRHPQVRAVALDALTCLVQFGPAPSIEAAIDALQQLDMGCRWGAL